MTSQACPTNGNYRSTQVTPQQDRHGFQIQVQAEKIPGCNFIIYPEWLKPSQGSSLKNSPFKPWLPYRFAGFYSDLSLTKKIQVLRLQKAPRWLANYHPAPQLPHINGNTEKIIKSRNATSLCVWVTIFGVEKPTTGKNKWRCISQLRLWLSVGHKLAKRHELITGMHSIESPLQYRQ